jgi:iron complex transport system substrate-binding protein
VRIVSLLGSATDLIVELGAADELVGRSHECDAPAVAHLPVLSRPTFDTTGSSGTIDRLVREKLRAGLPLYEVDEAALAALEPELVITQTHCEVCSVSPGDLGPTCTRKQVVAFAGGTLGAVREDFRAVARLIGRAETCERLLERLDADLATLAQRTRSEQGSPGSRPRVVCLEWIDPPFSMGNWGPEIVALAGGAAVLGDAGAASRSLPWEAVLAADPDVLVVAPCGFDLARTRREADTLRAFPGFAELRAVRAGRVYLADGNRSSPDLFRTPALLADMLHAVSGASRPPATNDFWVPLVEV